LLAYGVLWPYIGFNREALSRSAVYLVPLIMQRFLVRSAGLDGWHYLGSLRTEICPISKPAKLPQKQHNRHNAERLAALKGGILSSKFADPKLCALNVEFVCGDF
jgi:hypothetical protein